MQKLQRGTKISRKRRSGYLARKKTKSGRAILKRRRRYGRKRLVSVI